MRFSRATRITHWTLAVPFLLLLASGLLLYVPEAKALHVGGYRWRCKRKQRGCAQQNPLHDHPRSFIYDTRETTWRELGCFATMPER